MNTKKWWVYTGNSKPGDPFNDRVWMDKPAPPWRHFAKNLPAQEPPRDPLTEEDKARAQHFKPTEELLVDVVNAALYLRRPLLLAGPPGTGKSTLASSIAYELELGSVLHWPITSRLTLQEGLYRYDALGRLNALNEERSAKQETDPSTNNEQQAGSGSKAKQETDSPTYIGHFINLGPLGEAFLPSRRPRVLLIDEFDKCDIDLPNELLNLFERGEFDIPELRREGREKDWVYSSSGKHRIWIERGEVRCYEFPFIILTSNDEREFPPAFLRRCLRYRIQPPSGKLLEDIVGLYFKLAPEERTKVGNLIEQFINLREHQAITTDQLFQAIYLLRLGTELGRPDSTNKPISLADVLLQAIAEKP